MGPFRKPSRQAAERRGTPAGAKALEAALPAGQVARAAEYFQKWLAKWPAVDDLAAATLDEVNEVWAGLGYYRCARPSCEAVLEKCQRGPALGAFGSCCAAVSAGAGSLVQSDTRLG